MFGGAGAGIVVLLVPPILRLAARADLGRGRTDMHHTHRAPVPRLGGVAIAVAFVCVEVFLAFRSEQPGAVRTHLVILGGSLAMFALGFRDDLKPLGARKKLLGQIIIAGVVASLDVGIQHFKLPFTGQIIELHAWGFGLTILWLVGMTNLINLIDGVDGLAGGICLMLMVLLLCVGQDGGDLQLLAAGMGGALLGFLRYNFPPARIYLGDGGAYLLGFLIGILTMINSQKGTVMVALIAPLFVLALPILDTVLAILRRGLRGLPVFRPDRRHIHHHLMEMGLSSKKTVLSLYSLTLVFLVLGLLAYRFNGYSLALLAGFAALLLLICAGKLKFSRRWFALNQMFAESKHLRREIAYARCLTHWLALEGGRCQTVDELWDGFSFAAQKLGFSSIRLSLADGERHREWSGKVGREFSFRHEMQGGTRGILELSARQPSAEDLRQDPDSDAGHGFHKSHGTVVGQKSFEFTGELLAESWIKATALWAMEGNAGLRFNSRKLAPNRPGRSTQQPALLNATARLDHLSSQGVADSNAAA